MTNTWNVPITEGDWVTFRVNWDDQHPQTSQILATNPDLGVQVRCVPSSPGGPRRIWVSWPNVQRIADPGRDLPGAPSVPADCVATGDHSACRHTARMATSPTEQKTCGACGYIGSPGAPLGNDHCFYTHCTRCGRISGPERMAWSFCRLCGAGHDHLYPTTAKVATGTDPCPCCGGTGRKQRIDETGANTYDGPPCDYPDCRDGRVTKLHVDPVYRQMAAARAEQAECPRGCSHPAHTAGQCSGIRDPGLLIGSGRCLCGDPGAGRALAAETLASWPKPQPTPSGPPENPVAYDISHIRIPSFRELVPPPAADITTVMELQTALEDIRDRAAAELEDARAALSAAEQEAADVETIRGQCASPDGVGLHDDHLAIVTKIGPPCAAVVAAAQARVAAAEQKLAAARTAVEDVADVHTGFKARKAAGRPYR